MNNTGRLTIKDVAKLAGVSHSTVSRALNDSPLVGEATRERIRVIAEQTGFEFHEGARRLKNRKTGIVGLVYAAGLNDFRSSLYVNELFRDVRHELEKADLDALVVEAYDAMTGASNIARLIRQDKVDGFLIVHPSIHPEDLELIDSHGLAMVRIHVISGDSFRDGTDFFCADHIEGGRLAAVRLLEAGCRTFALGAIHNYEKSEFSDRTQGFLAELEDAGIPSGDIAVRECGDDYAAGYRFYAENRKRLSEIDGVFLPADIVAFGFLNALRESGIRVPDDIKIVAYDDSPISAISIPTLTTIHQPREQLSLLACERMRALLYDDMGGPAEGVFVPPTLVVRESC
ncbi:MAG: LacI family DNA-binding transcriptional regulator [Spirochaetaceae bacterium]|nr:LacI family DNA-binding transcriptional regulator [Spirochaetaceae bacterium]MDT8297833.1 LacI family DNA-binding transcriptional regulator [Spirochaetaceae bacterium]